MKKNKIKKEENYFLEKKYFYISELHMGFDGLESISDYQGPYNTLKTAQNAFKKYVMKDKFLNHWDYAIRGPNHTPKSILPHITPTKTIWYADGTLKKYN